MRLLAGKEDPLRHVRFFASAFFVVCLTLLCTVCNTNQIKAVAAPKSYMYSLSRPTYSAQLGAKVVSVQVLANGVNRRGLYVMEPRDNSVANIFGLFAGNILLTLDDRVIDSASSADSFLKGHQAGMIRMTYVPYAAGPPKVVSSTVEFDGANPIGVSATETNNTVAHSVSAPRSDMSIEQLERYGVEIINKSRQQEGVHMLEQSEALTKLARNYAQYMMARPQNFVFLNGRSPHVDNEGRNPAARAREAGINTYCGENIGMESRVTGSDKELLDIQHNKMMSEPPGPGTHRANILQAGAHFVGVGVARDKDRLYLVQEFGQ